MTRILSWRTISQLSCFHQPVSRYVPVRVVNLRRVLRSRPLCYSSLLHTVSVSQQWKPNSPSPMQQLYQLTHKHRHTCIDIYTFPHHTQSHNPTLTHAGGCFNICSISVHLLTGHHTPRPKAKENTNVSQDGERLRRKLRARYC